MPTERPGPAPGKGTDGASPMASARCEKLEKTYRTPTSEVRALRGISFTFPDARLTAVIGPSGSGKSSLLRLLTGMDRPSAGRVEVLGTWLDRASARSLRRLRRSSVGYVFQRPSDNFLPHLTIGEHLRMAAHGPARRGVGARELLDALSLAHRVDHLPAELSGGEQQRAAIAQVLIGGARLVIADEPTAELDSASARGVVDAIHDLSTGGVTFVVATHDHDVVRRADDVLELDHGNQRTHRSASPPLTTPEHLPLRSSAGPARALEEADGPRWRAPAPTLAADMLEEPPVLVVEGVSKTYHRGEEVVHALRDIDLSLPPGRLTGLVGRSGSGKTTLLNVVAGWERADEGTVTWDGRGSDVPSWSEIAVVPQKLGLLDDLTIRENIEYPARLSARVAEVAEDVEETLLDLGIQELSERYPKETSLGEQQRAAVARAIIARPKVLLADEPTGHQDAASTRRVFAVLERAAARGTSCLVATHNDEIVRFLDRVLGMSDGAISEA